MDLGYLPACLLTSKQASMAAFQHQNPLKRNNCQPYSALEGAPALGQEQLPLRRPSGRFYTWTRTVTHATPFRAPHVAAYRQGLFYKEPSDPHSLSDSSASTFAGFVRSDLFAKFRQPRLRPSAR